MRKESIAHCGIFFKFSKKYIFLSTEYKTKNSIIQTKILKDIFSFCRYNKRIIKLQIPV